MFSSVHAEAADNNWRAAYEQWLLLQRPSLIVNEQIMLYDLNFDGVPELFYGYPYFGLSPITNILTFENGQVKPVSVFEDGTEGMSLALSNIKEIECYYHDDSGTFSFFSPRLDQRNEVSSVEWHDLTYHNDEINLSRPIRTVRYTEIYSQEKLESKATAWEWDNVSVTQEQYNAKTQSHIQNGIRFNYSALCADETGKYWNDIWQTASDGTIAWNSKRLDDFMNAWTPSIVLGNVSATPTVENIQVNDTGNKVNTYKIYGNNYIRLRDAAKLLNQSSRQISVDWDGVKVVITSGAEYVEDKPSIEIGQTVNSASARFSNQAIYLDGSRLGIVSYEINGYNYVKLRDIMRSLGCSIDWDNERQLVIIKV